MPKTREELEHPGFVVVRELPAGLRDRYPNMGEFFGWWTHAGGDDEGRGGWRVPSWSRPDNARVFVCREHAVACAQCCSGYKIEIVELAYRDGWWADVDSAGHPVAWLCDECEDARGWLCPHRESRACVECRRVRPASFFTMLPDAQPIPESFTGLRNVSFFCEHEAGRAALVQAEPVIGVCDACAHARATAAAQRLGGDTTVFATLTV